jgi:hypothetical protein
MKEKKRKEKKGEIYIKKARTLLCVHLEANQAKLPRWLIYT